MPDTTSSVRRNIVIFSDGTNNDQGRFATETPEFPDGRDAVSNVYRLWRACKAAADRDETKQITYYDAGLGSPADLHDRTLRVAGIPVPFGRRIHRGLSWATGYGISTNILDCYDFIVRQYSKGDRIFLFGFSRGAYTVRSLGGMLALCGVVTPEQCGRNVKVDAKARAELCAQALEIYKTREVNGDKGARRKELGAAFRRDNSEEAAPYVIGVWDTVRALGVPGGNAAFDRVADRFEKAIPRRFHDHKLSRKVPFGFQALALDEDRLEFAAEPWDDPDPADADPASPTQIVEQVWFTGVHSDVGGSFADGEDRCRDLGRVTLAWMIERLARYETGLLVDETKLDLLPADKDRWRLGHLHNNWSGRFSRLYRRRDRDIDPDCVVVYDPPAKRIHGSISTEVRDRMQLDTTYRPVPLQKHRRFGWQA